ncbi:hypothetical protein PMI35_06306 [Pseudomonas sp. GM78]|uniref:hypothetical protein n=1 Tax=Pseudomonas sp. GM78 TaxID=1144337 RepID=UPI0002706AE5|nr:hypothetical protein [Pseudomonas sp. GM78]EJN18189.1 hypothetical protein PMI35_06306 [Pseudomonas sp. GM78]
MNTNVSPRVSNELFELYPLLIPNWVPSVKPEGIAHGGIPQALYDGQAQGLECLVKPWTESQFCSFTVAVGDRVDLYVNDDPTPVAGKTVAAGEEQHPIRFYLPHGHLNHGVNRLYYTVTTESRGAEPSRDLLVLYHLDIANDPDLKIPLEILKNGVDGKAAAQGVEFGFRYSNWNKYDVIEFRLGKTNVRFEVPDAPASITRTLFTGTFQEAGDNDNTLAEFVVIDQLGNQSKPENRLDIDLNRVSLQVPKVEGMAGSDFDPTLLEIRVLVPEGRLLPSDKLIVSWQGQAGIPASKYTSPQQQVSDGLEIVVPLSVLAYSLGKPVDIAYVVERNGQSTPSPSLTLNVLELPASALTPPEIVEAVDGVLDVTALGEKNATIHALLWTLIEEGQSCWMSVEGKKTDGTPHNMRLWNGLPAVVNPVWISQGFWPQVLGNKYLNELGADTELTLKFKVSLDKSNNEETAVVFTDRTYKVAVEPILEENFDLQPTSIINSGESIEIPSMRISFTKGDGLVAIAPMALGNPEYPGKLEGQLLHTNYTYTGSTPQEVVLHLRSTYSKVNFWIAMQNFPVDFNFYAAGDVFLEKITSKTIGVPEEITCSRPGIVKIVIQPGVSDPPDWIAFDTFTFAT